MKKDYDFKTKLKLIKYSSLISLIISVTLFINNNTKILAIIILICALLFEWRFYRCPNCKASLDSRINIYKNPHCPHCGKII